MVGRHDLEVACVWKLAPPFRRDQRDRSLEWYRATYGTWLTPTKGNFLLGVLSESENKTISAGLNDVIMDHFVDAVDRNGSTELVFRSGATKSIEPGSWIVNCTGYALQDANTRTSLTFPTVGLWSRFSYCLPHAFDVVHGLLPHASVILEKLRDSRCTNSTATICG